MINLWKEVKDMERLQNNLERQRPEYNFRVLRNIKSAAELGPIADDMYEVVKSAFNRPDFDKEDALAHVSGDYLILAMDGQKVVGFSTLVMGSPRKVFGDPQLPEGPANSNAYFAAAAIAEDVQGQGLYEQMNRKRMELAMDDDLVQAIFTRTQNPLVEQSISTMLADLKKRGRIDGFSLERIHMPKVYSGMLTGEKPPRSKDPVIQAAHDKLNLEEGDAYVLIYHLRESQQERSRRSLETAFGPYCV